ncbi:hypothetical protein PR048_017808 [Dryococelus australis]|uniref:Uncharacterized protein n=1 Tax=Dryococelus australis TaxID=614101 RepID=A0ABQ9HAI9_9NEOP|nr:hypothetical protein PR048_017808 [Dryococelus australis]
MELNLEIWVAVNNEVLRANEGEVSSAGMQMRGKREIPRKPADQRHRPARLPLEKIPDDTHKTSYDRVKRRRERKINIKASERVDVDVFTQNKRACPSTAKPNFLMLNHLPKHAQVSSQPITDMQENKLGIPYHMFRASKRRAGGNRRYPRKYADQRHRLASSTNPTCENPMTQLGIEYGPPWWEASELTARPPRPQYDLSPDFSTVQESLRTPLPFVIHFTSPLPVIDPVCGPCPSRHASSLRVAPATNHFAPSPIIPLSALYSDRRAGSSSSRNSNQSKFNQVCANSPRTQAEQSQHTAAWRRSASNMQIAQDTDINKHLVKRSRRVASAENPATATLMRTTRIKDFSWLYCLFLHIMRLQARHRNDIQPRRPGFLPPSSRRRPGILPPSSSCRFRNLSTSFYRPDYGPVNFYMLVRECKLMKTVLPAPGVVLTQNQLFRAAYSTPSLRWAGRASVEYAARLISKVICLQDNSLPYAIVLQFPVTLSTIYCSRALTSAGCVGNTLLLRNPTGRRHMQTSRVIWPAMECCQIWTVCDVKTSSIKCSWSDERYALSTRPVESSVRLHASVPNVCDCKPLRFAHIQYSPMFTRFSRSLCVPYRSQMQWSETCPPTPLWYADQVSPDIEVTTKCAMCRIHRFTVFKECLYSELL